MTRVKSPRLSKRRSLFRATKGYKHPSNSNFKLAHQRYLKAQVHAFRDRKNKKRTFKQICNLRLNALTRLLWQKNLNTFIYQLKNSQILLNRKVMAQLAVFDWFFFYNLLPSWSNQS